MMADETNLEISTPRWALPLLPPNRYKGAKGGRGGGKSHFFAELLVEEHICNPDQQSVCIREVQKSIKFSIKKLIEAKIKRFGVSHLFEITQTEIRRIGHDGIIIFQGMQDHTADSIKSLEGFDRALVDEAQNISKRSMEMLLPTIRKEESEIWFAWNPDSPNDPVDVLFKQEEEGMVCVHVNYPENPFCTAETIKEAEKHKKRDLDTFDHIWLGGYNFMSKEVVFSGKWRKDKTIKPPKYANLYYGADWGFANDPSVLLRCWVDEEKREINVDYEISQVGVEIDDHPDLFDQIEGSRERTITADSARPETISYLNRNGFRVEAAIKGPNSVIEGVNFLKSYKIVVHPRCERLISELSAYRYKKHKNSGEILPVLVDKDNHCIDALRYALEKLMFAKGSELEDLLKMAIGD